MWLLAVVGASNPTFVSINHQVQGGKEKTVHYVFNEGILITKQIF